MGGPTQTWSRSMDDAQVARMWDDNADVWTEFSRLGYDEYRDQINTPAFMDLLPDVAGQTGLDVGCGEGHNTRLLAERGAQVVAIDIATRFMQYAIDAERTRRLGISYVRATGRHLPFGDEIFGFCTAIMSLMDVHDQLPVLGEIHRVLVPGGFLQFSITHPCFGAPGWSWHLDQSGRRVGMVCRDYFQQVQGEAEEWIFGAAPPESREGARRFVIPRFTHTLSYWLNAVVDAGLRPERFVEPFASDEVLQEHPRLYSTRIVAPYLIVRCRKAGVDGA